MENELTRRDNLVSDIIDYIDTVRDNKIKNREDIINALIKLQIKVHVLEVIV